MNTNIETMTEQEYNGYIAGLWHASMVCELHAGQRKSRHAARIMSLLQTTKLKREEVNKKVMREFSLVDFIKEVHHA